MTTFLCLYSIFLLALNNQVFPSVLTQLGGNPRHQGLFLTSLFLLLPVSSAFAGLVADRFGKKIVLITGAGFLALPFAITALIHDYWLRIAAVLSFGIGLGAVEGQASALLTDLHPGKERAIINLSQVFFCAGAAGGPFFISLAYKFVPGLELKSLLLAVAVVTTTVIFGFFFLRDTISTSALSAPGGFNNVLSDREGRLLLISIFFYVAAEMGTAGWITKYAELDLYLPRASAPLSLTLFWGGLAVSRIIVSFALHNIRDTGLISTGLCITLIFQVSAFLIKIPLIALIFFFLTGFGMGTVWPTLVAMTGARYRESSGSAVGLTVASGAAAVPIIHQLIGWLSQDHLLGLRFTLSGLGIFTFLNLFIVNRIVNIQKKNS
jgi:fucose permease